MHRFPHLPAPEPARAVAKSLPLPSLPWAEITVFGMMALVLALS